MLPKLETTQNIEAEEAEWQALHCAISQNLISVCYKLAQLLLLVCIEIKKVTHI